MNDFIKTFTHFVLFFVIVIAVAGLVSQSGHSSSAFRQHHEIGDTHMNIVTSEAP